MSNLRHIQYCKHGDECCLRAAPDWSVLNGCFPNSKVRVSDIDGAVEVNSHFLVLEHKNHGVPLPTGQRIMYERMVQSGFADVLVLWAKGGQCVEAQWLGTSAVFPCDETRLRQEVKTWAEWAQALPSTTSSSFRG